MKAGFFGRLLEVNLTDAKITTKDIPEDILRKYLGGSGLAAYYLFQEDFQNFEPFSPESPLIISAGLLVGSGAPTAARAAFCAKSPLTGIWAESTVGGYWATQLRKNGLDCIIIRGKAKKPSFLWLNDGNAELRDAAEIWGMETYDTNKRLKELTSPQAEVAAIGPAGEKLVRFASVMIGGHDARAAGRTGMGAVMGSKNLKAIVCCGTKELPVFDKEGLKKSIRRVMPEMREKTKGLRMFGTAGGVEGVEANGELPIRNWTMGSWEEGAGKVCGQAMAETILTGHYACAACTIRCGLEVEVRKGPHEGTIAHGPEYETVAGFGSMCLNEDIDYIAAANDLCNRLGIDTISGAAAVSFAMELYENGLLTAAQSDGLDPVWGNGEAILSLLTMIAERKGVGDILAEGTVRAAEKFAPLAKEFLVASKGMELAFHDPRGFTSMSVIYGTANRGGCHLEGLTYFIESGAVARDAVGFYDELDPHGVENKADLAKVMQDYLGVFNPLGLCKFLMRGNVDAATIAEWIKMVTGWDMDADELLTIGERLFNLKREFNVRLGISRKDDFLTPRILSHARPSGRSANSLPFHGRMLHEFYQLRGWSPEGIPKKGKLQQLGLEWVRTDAG